MIGQSAPHHHHVRVHGRCGPLVGRKVRRWPYVELSRATKPRRTRNYRQHILFFPSPAVEKVVSTGEQRTFRPASRCVLVRVPCHLGTLSLSDERTNERTNERSERTRSPRFPAGHGIGICPRVSSLAGCVRPPASRRRDTGGIRNHTIRVYDNTTHTVSPSTTQVLLHLTYT